MSEERIEIAYSKPTMVKRLLAMLVDFFFVGIFKGPGNSGPWKNFRQGPFYLGPRTTNHDISYFQKPFPLFDAMI